LPRPAMTGMATVRLRGLQTEHLNGLLALCKGFDETKGRWLVMLSGGDEKFIKNDNILTLLEPGATLMLERNCVAHVTVGLVSQLDQMESTWREQLDLDLDELAQSKSVQAELNCIAGWPQFSVVLRGVPEDVQRALPELERLFDYYGIVFKCSGVGVTLGEDTSKRRHIGHPLIKHWGRARNDVQFRPRLLLSRMLMMFLRWMA